MNNPRINEYRRSPGAFRAAWVTLLVLTLGLLGAGSSGPTQPSDTGYSDVADALFGVPSSTGINALLNGSRTANDGADDGDLPAAPPSILADQDLLHTALVADVATTYPVNRYLQGPSPRAPPLI